MANQFDRWRKDAFFSAAEEVQESADIMLSAYRIWERERRQGLATDDAVELGRELHTALGTTKWQLEEFERAVKLCHQDNFAEDMVSRHKQFVRAIEFQVSRIEKALRYSIIEEGKQPFRWVQLDKQDRNDLSLFLSGTPEGLKDINDTNINSGSPTKEGSTENQNSVCISMGTDFVQKESNIGGIDAGEIPVSGIVFQEALTITEEPTCTIELAEKNIEKAEEAVQFSMERLDGPQRILRSSEIDAWKIAIADEDANGKALEAHSPAISCFFGLLISIEYRIKLSLYRSSFRKWKVDCHQENAGISSYLDLNVTQRLSLGISAFSERSRSCLRNCKEDVKTSHAKQFLGRADGLRWQLKSLQYYVQSNPSLKFSLMILPTILFIAAIVLSAI